MMSLLSLTLLSTFIGLVLSQTPSSSPQSWTPSSPAATSGTVFSSTGAPTASADDNAPMCGRGFTYCGYILRDHQKYKEEDIVKSYCAAAKDNCANGKTKTDPIQALYVCVPPAATAEKDQLSAANNDNIQVSKNLDGTWSVKYLDEEQQQQSQPKRINRFVSGLFNHNLSSNNNKRQHISTVTLSPNTVAVAPSPAQSSPGPGANANNGIGGDSCSDTDTPGNKIELICSCGGQCLNPDADHIGRCDAPCS
ncbi:hypothetical protein QBC38DRAFT_440996 [Podospora fimiseda]|uniref:Uncharacterized protein n=1 Tax=Podospora fimiseda TaxID=252190 RepID=A0AAN7BW14_9PEZI|nr:hypothetical protein QBC38DRAFT_440996 [Podospora fimiseda]